MPSAHGAGCGELIDWYRCRWEIETLFHVLKNGCRVEALQLGHVKKLELALALYLVVAWRLAHLLRLGRVHPELPASEVFDQIEWQAAWLLAENVEWSQTGSSSVKPRNHRYMMLKSICSTSARSERIVKGHCNNDALNNLSGAIDGRPPSA